MGGGFSKNKLDRIENILIPLLQNSYFIKIISIASNYYEIMVKQFAPLSSSPSHDLSKYTVPTSFVEIAVPIKVVGMLVLSALPTKVVGVHAVYQIRQIQE